MTKNKFIFFLIFTLFSFNSIAKGDCKYTVMKIVDTATLELRNNKTNERVLVRPLGIKIIDKLKEYSRKIVEAGTLYECVSLRKDRSLGDYVTKDGVLLRYVTIDTMDYEGMHKAIFWNEDSDRWALNAFVPHLGQIGKYVKNYRTWGNIKDFGMLLVSMKVAIPNCKMDYIQKYEQYNQHSCMYCGGGMW